MTTSHQATSRTAATTLAGEQNPFLRYRERLDAYEVVRSGAFSDEQFVELVGAIDDDIASVWGHGFVVSPLIDGQPLAQAAGLSCRLSIKVEAGSVGGSHKARHLMGALLHRRIAEDLGTPKAERLAIASCGNAALGAAVLANAWKRPLSVFVPVWADPAVVAELDRFGADITRCERREGEVGDPCYLRFREAIQDGAEPFSVQGTDTPTTFDGGRTLGWEIEEQGGAVDALYVQVGGGALATSVSRGLPEARLHPVQAAGCAPLHRAWQRMGGSLKLPDAQAADQPFMTAWQDPQSFATGILDDITYDWIPLLRQTEQTSGHPIVATEANVVAAYELAHTHTSVNVCPTGTAGFAGLLTEPAPAGEHVAVLFTGRDTP